MTSELDLTSMPYADRQLVVVGADLVVSAQRAVDRKAEQDSKAWKDVVVDGVLAGLAGPMGLFSAALEAYNKAKQSDLDMLLISRTEAKQLSFPLGHPRDRLLYVGHPADAALYVPMADFHRFLFEHKVAEALRLVRSLGATEIEVEHITGWRSREEAGVGLNMPMPDTAAIGAQVARGSSEGRRILSRMSLQPTQPPRLPDRMVWYEHEPLWVEVAHARLESGLRSFELDVSYADDFGVTAGLKAAVANVGLDMGGSFVEHRSTVWRLQGRF